MEKYQQNVQKTVSSGKEITLLKTLDNPHNDRDYIIALDISGLSCLCPIDSHPSFADLTIEYIPDHACLELKSLKQYIYSFRNSTSFQENLINSIRDQLAAAIAPRYLRLTAKFHAVDGVSMQITTDYRKKDWLAGQLSLPQYPGLLEKPD